MFPRKSIIHKETNEYMIQMVSCFSLRDMSGESSIFCVIKAKWWFIFWRYTTWVKGFCLIDESCDPDEPVSYSPELLIPALLNVHAVFPYMYWHRHCLIPFHQRSLPLLDSSCIYLPFPSIWFQFPSKPALIKQDLLHKMQYCDMARGWNSRKTVFLGNPLRRVQGRVGAHQRDDLVWSSGHSVEKPISHCFNGSSKKPRAGKTRIWHVANILHLMGSFIP